MSEQNINESKRPLSGVSTAIDVLEFLAGQQRDIPLADIAKALDLSKSALHRTLSTLSGRGYTERLAGGRYRLGLKVWELGAASPHTLLIRVATPVLERLAHETGEGTLVSVREGFDVVTMATARSTHAIRIDAQPGTRTPANWGGVGILFMAHMGEAEASSFMDELLKVSHERGITNRAELEREVVLARNRGMCVAQGIWSADAIGINVPVLGADGGIRACLNLHGPRYRLTDEALARMIPKVTDAAKEISSALDIMAARPDTRQAPEPLSGAPRVRSYPSIA